MPYILKHGNKMPSFKRWDARRFPVLAMIPGSGTGIQLNEGRIQPYTVWNNTLIEQFCYNENEAYFVLQEVLDGYRVGEDYEETEDDENEDF